MRFLTEVINFRMGLVGALFMGGIVFFINLDSNWQQALFAAVKQGMYTLFFGGFVIKICENLSLKYSSKSRSIIAAAIIPALIAILATYLVHQLKGTPKPIESLIPTILLSFPGFLFIGYRKRSQQQT